MIPTATYRIQFRNGMTFDRAAERIPYLKQLGISHLYASPIFTATSGSTHGYDVTNTNEIDPDIGGREGFDRLVRALKHAGLGLILDIVPNHMAASMENPWWRDVLEYGKKSRYAHHFDIDWSRRLTLPFLGDSFENALEKGEISIKRSPENGKPALAYYESFYPLVPESWEGREEAILSLSDKAKIAQLHDQQPWQLLCWRDAASNLSYRRFFEITGLVGVRVEDETVFDDTHQLILELVHSGAVDGLRVDHIDGLADPKAYLDRLRQKVGPACYITVEKILGHDEQLPADWPISGTTGYEFIASLSDVLVDDEKIPQLRSAYVENIGKDVDMKAELRAAKFLMVDRNFAGEFNRLLALALDIAAAEKASLHDANIQQALRELLIAFPVYRTYGTEQGMPQADQALLRRVADKVSHGAFAPDSAALEFLVSVLTGEVSAAARANAAIFRTRFQQLTGPLMAKSVEDTLFFRQNMDLALNEVGAEPLPRAFYLNRFHSEMKTRLLQQPDALSCTSTHDTKRGEDARARLYTLTEAPQLWAQCVKRWQQMNAQQVVMLEDGAAPKPGVTWMIFQALAGVWPVSLKPDDADGLAALEERFVAFIEKALREAKLRTDWAGTNDAYENAVLDYVRHLLSNQAFLADFTTALQPFIHAGLVNSLTQTVIKLTAPGVPDIYQGSEALNFSLVDPDNRLPPDFSALEQLLAEDDKSVLYTPQGWLSGQLKQHLIATLLTLRQQKTALFRRGDYVPLSASGAQADNVIAYARVGDKEALIVIAPRLVFGMPDDGTGVMQAEIAIPEELINRRYRDMLSGKEIELTARYVPKSAGNFSPVILISA